jgi:hypothetical protein
MKLMLYSLIRSRIGQPLLFAANQTLIKREPAIYSWRCRAQDWVS